MDPHTNLPDAQGKLVPLKPTRGCGGEAGSRGQKEPCTLPQCVSYAEVDILFKFYVFPNRRLDFLFIVGYYTPGERVY
uniref:Uncharacterized protein n=1 Tax=Knipowitschia caucasica TaxID=637954 RepID=A0AAV2L3L9_KNICA